MPKRKPLEERRASGDTRLTTDEVADRLAVTVWGVRRMVRAGKLEAINIGTEKRRILRFNEAALTKFEKRAAA